MPHANIKNVAANKNPEIEKSVILDFEAQQMPF
jgi:hypothetical protein